MLIARHGEDRPHVHGLAVTVGPVCPAHVLEAFRQNADDPEHPPREAHDTADDIGIAVEAPHPQRVTEDDDVVVAFNLVRQFEFASDRRLSAKQFEESGRDLHAAQLLRLLEVTELQVGALVRGNALKCLEFRAIVAEVRRRHREMWCGRCLLKQAHEAFRIRVRQGRDENALHGAKDGCVCANGQCERQDGSSGKGR